MKKLCLILFLVMIVKIVFPQSNLSPQINYSLSSSQYDGNNSPIVISDVKGNIKKINVFCNDDRTYYTFIGDQFFKYKGFAQVSKLTLTPDIQIENGHAIYSYRGCTILPISAIYLDSVTLASLLIRLDTEKFKKVTTKNCNMGLLSIASVLESAQSCKQFFVNSNFDTIAYRNLLFANTPVFKNCKILNFRLKDCVIKNNMVFENIPLPRSINFENIDFEGTASMIDLTDFDNPNGSSCNISLLNCDISHLKLDYINFKLSFAGSGYSVTEGGKETIYKQLLDEQKRDGFDDGYKKLAIEYKEYKYQKNPTFGSLISRFLDRVWWDYGFDTKAIVINSLQIFLLFFAINLLIYQRILVDGYPVKTFVDANKRLDGTYPQKHLLRRLYKAFYCLIFTGYIFWGIKLDFDKIKLINIIIPSYIIIQYMAGLLCITYIIHYYFAG